MGIELLRPELAVALVAALVPLLLCLWELPRRMRALRLVAEPRHLRRVFPGLAGAGADALGWIRRRAWSRAGLVAVGMSLVALSWMGPVRGFALVPVEQRRIDVVVALDTSRSMLVEDVEPNRLERAKVEIGALLDAMTGERVSLLAFAGSARDVAPLTADLDTVRYFLEELSPEDNRRGGTDLGAALNLALERFDGSGGSSEAVILVTDGEDLTGEGLAAAEVARDRGVRVHVLGMGTAGGGKVPDGEGGFVVDPDASAARAEVVSQLRSESLRAIADATGGIYLEAKGRVLPLEELYRRAISTMEGRDIVDGKERVPRDRFQWPLVLALLILMVEGAALDSRRVRVPASIPSTEDPAVGAASNGEATS
jgi:Ca-activated chloride channel family protein